LSIVLLATGGSIQFSTLSAFLTPSIRLSAAKGIEAAVGSQPDKTLQLALSAPAALHRFKTRGLVGPGSVQEYRLRGPATASATASPLPPLFSVVIGACMQLSFEIISISDMHLTSSLVSH
jgi:hypothetical protein